MGRLPPIPRRQAEAESGPLGVWRDSLTTPRELPEETLRTLEARQAAAWISGQVAHGLRPSGVMVLSRKRAGLLPLQDELRALHIPALIGEKTALIDCCEVLDIVALLDVLVSPQHDLSLARALRSPLFGLSDDALVQIAVARGDSRWSWFEVLQKSELLAPATKGLAPVLLQYQSWLGSLPPHDALQAIYHHGDVLARFAAAAPAANRASVLANLGALLTAALQLDGGRYATPYAFVRALKAGGLQAPATVDSQAVRLLTIHGAKGLEAEAVLLLDTDTAERNGDNMGVLVDWPGAASAPQKFVFLVSETRPPACALEVLGTEQEARRREELNALYVALTRARQTLVLSSITPYRAAPDSWWQRLAGCVPDCLAPPPANAGLAQSDVAEPLCSRSCRPPLRCLRPTKRLLLPGIRCWRAWAMPCTACWSGAGCRTRGCARCSASSGWTRCRRVRPPTGRSASCPARVPGPGTRLCWPGRATRWRWLSRASCCGWTGWCSARTPGTRATGGCWTTNRALRRKSSRRCWRKCRPTATACRPSIPARRSRWRF